MQRLGELRKGTAADLEAGEAAFQRGDFESAAAAYRRAVAASPEDARAYGNLGSALWRLGDAEGALGAYREALRLKPDDAISHFNLGVVLAARGDDAAAVAEYHEAVRRNPSYASARFNLANALRRAGRCEEARAQYAWIAEREPQLVPPRIGEVGCLVCLGKHKAALARVEQGLGTLPGNPALKTVWARLLATSPDASVRNGSEALRIAREVSLPASAESLETLAMALAASGSFAEALSTQKAAIAAANGSGRRDLLGRLGANLERYQQGRACRDPGL
jgi:predicted O-linked N-acetylglucosamine transferase (SPINDLY family)